MRLTYIGFTIVFIICAVVDGKAQSRTLQQLKETNQIERKFYFYPSTLRMLNLQQNPEFNALIKDIRKLIFFKMRRDTFGLDQFSHTLSELKQKESFEEYMEIQGGEQKLFVLGKERPYNTVILTKQQNEYYLAEIIGQINVLQIPNLYRKISEGDSTIQNGFVNIFDLMGGSNQQADHEEDTNPLETDSLPEPISND